MSRKKIEKKIVLLEPSFNDVLTCQKKELRPYLEVLMQEGENVSHENLGILLGIFEITDNSEDSSYVVNYIISVIKKEYFSKGKRGPIESFELALHKANLALSKLAQHENISWIGKFNALVAVIEKNNLHFSQAGNAAALLLRKNILTDISDGMSEDSTPNPLKTFTSLSSGKMEEEDKLILVTPEIFDIFSLEEIKKAALRFSETDFIQFLKTALGNELEKTAVLVADIHRKEIIKEKKSLMESQIHEVNAFSQKAYIPKARPQEEKNEILNDLEEALEKENPSDKKYGHIYIKEEFESQKEKKFNENADLFKETLRDLWKKTKENSSGEKFKKTLGSFKSEIKNKEVRKSIQLGWASFWQKTDVFFEVFFQKTKKLWDKLYKKTRISDYFGRNSTAISKESFAIHPAIPSRKISLPDWKKILPSFPGIAKKIKSFSKKQQLYALAFLLLIFVVPLFIAKYINNVQNKPAVQSPPPQSTTDASFDVSAQNSNTVRAGDGTIAFSGKNLQGIINLNDSFFAISSGSLVQISSQKTWPVPDNFGEITKFTAMNDLNLIFITNKDNKVLSFSPTSQKFQENILNLPENSQIEALGTFMTYLYILDSKNSQIYRYPRAEGGFGEKINWLKAPADLSGYENTFVTDSVYIWGKENFAKFFKGKKEDMTLENISSPENISSLYADENSIYVLDKNEGLIKKFGTDGKFISQIFSDKIKTAQNLAVSSDGKTFYLSSPDEVIYFSVK